MEKYWSLNTLNRIFIGPFNNSQKSLIFNICMLPRLTYGCQICALTLKIINRKSTTQHFIERSIINVKKK